MSGIYQLGTYDCNDRVNTFVRQGVVVDAPPTEWDERESLHGINRQTRVRTNRLRQIVLPMQIYGSSADDMRTRIALLRAECAKVSNTFTMGRKGESTPRTFVLVRQTQPSVPWDLLYDQQVAQFDLILTAEPFAYGPETTLYNASAGGAPRVLNLSSMVGDYPAPLEVTLTATADKIATAHLGLIPDLAFTSYREGEALSWGVPQFVADATAHGGFKQRGGTSLDLATYADTRAYLQGTYLPLVRAKTSANSMRIGVGYGGAELAGLTLANTFWKTLALKRLALPIAKTRVGTAANLQLRSQQNVSGSADVDWFGLCPLSWGHASWSAPGDVTALIFGYDGTLYADGVASAEYKTGGPLYGFRTDRLCIFADDIDGTHPSLPLNVTIKYVPRYAE